MLKMNLRLVVLVFLLTISCARNKPVEVYQKFENQVWPRYQTLKFEIPVIKPGNTYDIILFTNITRAFSFETLDFNMVMNTPAGEERINEYQIKIKSPVGSFLGKCGKDSCIYTIPLKKGLSINDSGILKIEIENLTPRIETSGILGMGVRLIKSD